MAKSKVRKISGWVLAVLMAAAFFVAGLGKLTGSATEMFEGWGYAPWFATLIGVLEMAGAIGLLIPRLARLAIMGLTGIMIGAAYTHYASDEMADILRPVIFTAVLWVLCFLRSDSSESA